MRRLPTNRFFLLRLCRHGESGGTDPPVVTELQFEFGGFADLELDDFGFASQQVWQLLL